MILSDDIVEYIGTETIEIVKVILKFNQKIKTMEKYYEGRAHQSKQSLLTVQLSKHRAENLSFSYH